MVASKRSQPLVCVLLGSCTSCGVQRQEWWGKTPLSLQQCRGSENSQKTSLFSSHLLCWLFYLLSRFNWTVNRFLDLLIHHQGPTEKKKFTLRPKSANISETKNQLLPGRLSQAHPRLFLEGRTEVGEQETRIVVGKRLFRYKRPPNLLGTRVSSGPNDFFHAPA